MLAMVFPHQVELLVHRVLVSPLVMVDIVWVDHIHQPRLPGSRVSHPRESARPRPAG